MVSSVNFEHLLNAEFPIFVILSESDSDSNAVHSIKALSPIVVTEFGITIETSLLQKPNAYLLITFILSGIMTVVSPLPLKTPGFMKVHVGGMVIVDKLVQ